MATELDCDFERPITFNEAGRFLPEGTRPSYATWWRWWRKGIRGIRLRTLVCGGRRYTTASAVQEFFAKVTTAANGEPMSTRPPCKRERGIRQAAAKMGISLEEPR